MSQYNLRNRTIGSPVIATNRKEIADSEENLEQEDEMNNTIVEQDEISKLQEQIKNLQSSLAASEKERLCLQQTLESTPLGASAAPKATVSSADMSQIHAIAPAASRNYGSAMGYPAYSSFPDDGFAAEHTIRSSAHLQNACANHAHESSNRITNSAATIEQARECTYTNVTSFAELPASVSISNTNANVTTTFHRSRDALNDNSRITGNYPSFYLPNVDSAEGNFGRHAPRNTNNFPAYNNMWSPSFNQPPMRKLRDLPEFSGLPEEWPMFFVAFKETTNNFGYSNFENLQRLQKCLKGNARSRVESLLIHPSSVNAIISTLQFHFGRPDLLVRSQLSKARAFPAITGRNVSEIINLSTMVSNLVAFLENAGASPHLSNPTLLEELVSKLPLNKRDAFAINKPYPTIQEFSIWLQQTSMYVAMATEINMPKSNVNTDQTSQKGNRFTRPVLTIGEEKRSCQFCNLNHKLYQCTDFKEADYEKRWEVVKKNRLCFCCLSPNHNMQNCPRRRECGVSSCRKYHNKLLHNHTTATLQTGNAPSKQTAVATVSECQKNKCEKDKQKINKQNAGSPKNNVCGTLLKFVPVKLYGPKGSLQVMAFIDDGAKVTLLEERVANHLGLKGATDLLHLKWFDDQTTTEVSKRVDVEISSVHESMRFHMKDVRTIKKLLLPPQTLYADDFKRTYEDLRNIPIDSYEDAIPRILIGVSHTNIVRPLCVVNFAEGYTAHETKIGWTLFGSNENGADNTTICHVHIEDNDMSKLHKQVSEFFKLENFEINALPEIKSVFDIRAEQILEKTTKLNGGRYETGLLWQNDDVSLPESYNMALKRLQTVERKMMLDENYAKWYKQKISEYVEKGYAKKLTSTEAEHVDGRTWYLPHFAVYNLNKGNKPRLVFDAAAKTNGVSLNSVLMKGPDFYQPKSLQSILFKFREGKIAVCADIREMFHRVNIRELDQNAQRFLWREGDQVRQPDVYVMVAMIFGSICSPCSAQYVKNLNANMFKEEYPRAVEAIVDRHYVDDYVDSFSSVNDAISVTKKVTDIHKEAGFELRGFVSNSDELLQAIYDKSTPGENISSTKYMCSGESAYEKVLGMHWDANHDAFAFKFMFSRIPKQVLDGTRRPTKAELLGLTMSIFDPYGFLSHITLVPKILLQKLWQLNVQWHEAIPNEIYEVWYQWYRALSTLKEFIVPRCYHLNFTEPSANIQLHIFVDASEVAYAAVAYWRICHYDEVSIVFVVGKSRCSPIKPLSIPRLELQSAVLGTRLKDIILSSHTIKPQEIVFWSDSKTVIQWVRSEARRYKQFVCNRISEILHSSEVSQWRWVPGSQNPADDATRPQKEVSLSSKCRWITGPTFLEGSEDSWPTMPERLLSVPDEEEKRKKQLFTIEAYPDVIPFVKYSNYYRFLRIMTWVRFAVSKFKKYKRNNAGTGEAGKINARELNTTEYMLVRIVQEATFSEDISLLRKGKLLPKNSSLFSLTPIIDTEGVLRLGGRIDNAESLPMCTRRPIIMPKNHAMSRLIVRHHHEMFYHQNPEAIICAIRSKYWIPNLRSLLKSIKHECQLSKNNTAAPKPPLMGQIPIDRLTPYIRPFSYTGLDYFGPMMVSIGRRREKRWVALFTCLTVRAIHLEMARDLSSDAVILCLRNFINRRGIPVRIRSDRGTNFVEASKIEWVCVENSLEAECTRRGIEWIFNSPANPSAGGAWERMVRSVKRVLSFTLKEVAPQIETLQSLLIEAENLINSRPLTHLPVESIDSDPITPNHFILGCPNYIQTSDLSKPVCLRNQWRIVQQLKQTFWRRWVLEYLPTLTRRTKWQQPVKPIETGDVVIICDDKESRGEWKRGVVLEVYPAPDGQVRSALVKTASGNLRRPASKLAVLDVRSEPQIADAPSIHGGRDVIERSTM